MVRIVTAVRKGGVQQGDFTFSLIGWRGRDSSVGIATRYGLDGPGDRIPVGGARLPAPVQTAPGAHPASYIMGTGSFPGVKRPRRGVDHPPPYSAEVEGRVELYICSPSGPSWPVVGWPLPLLVVGCEIRRTGYITVSFTGPPDWLITHSRVLHEELMDPRYIITITVSQRFRLIHTQPSSG